MEISFASAWDKQAEHSLKKYGDLISEEEIKLAVAFIQNQVQSSRLRLSVLNSLLYVSAEKTELTISELEKMDLDPFDLCYTAIKVLREAVIKALRNRPR